MSRKRFSIKTKLYAVITSVLVVMMILIFLRTQQINHEMDDYNREINSIIARKEYMINIVLGIDSLLVDNMVIAYSHYEVDDVFTPINLLESSDTTKDEILSNLYLYREALLRDIILDESALKQHIGNIDDTISAFVEYFIPAMQELRYAAYVDDKETVMESLNKLLPTEQNVFRNQILELKDRSFEHTTNALNSMTQKYRIEQGRFLVYLIVGLIVSMLIAYFFIRSITTAISGLTFAMKKVQEGNFQYPIRTGHTDEFGLLSDDIEKMVGTISEMNKASTIADYLHTMILVKDMDNEVVYVNSAFSKAYKFDKNDPSNKKVIIESLKKYTDYLILPEEENETRAHFGFTWEPIIDKWITGSIVLRKWVDGRMVYCYYINDSTERKRYHDQKQEYEDDLRESIKREKEATAAKNDFIANTSHEIRTPMNSIIGYSELVLDDETLPVETREYINRIVTNAEWLLNVIGDIMDFSKIESGKLEIEHAPFDLKSVMENCKYIVLPEATSKGLDVHFFIDSFPEEKLIGDRVRLSQVCINLLSNAIKFTDVGSVIFTVTRVSRKKDICVLDFSVSDTGIGMTKEQMDKIFDPYVQADSSTTRKYGGTGLGLAISKKIVQSMGGELKLRSVINRGSEFKFTLEFPIIKLSEEGSNIEEMPKPKFRDKAVLVVEDNEMNQAVIYEHLKRVGITPMIMSNGKIAVDYVLEQMEKTADSKPFDLILMDINMPVMDGVEANRLLKENGVTSPVVAITANVITSSDEMSEVQDMQGYITKPFTSRQLWKVLTTHMAPDSLESADIQLSDQRFMQKMNVDFVEKYSNFYEEMTNAIDDKDYELAYRMAHNLKSNAGYIHQDELHDIAEKLEQHIVDRKIGSKILDELSYKLASSMYSLVPSVEWSDKEKVNLENQIKTHQVSREEIQTTFEELEVLLGENNMDGMLYIEKLYTIPNTHQLICEIEDLNFKEALEEIKLLKEKMTN